MVIPMQTHSFDLAALQEAEDARASNLGGAALCAVIAMVIAGAVWHLSAPSRWPATTGIVLESHYFPYGSKHWGPSIYYEYEVDARTFISDNITTWQSPSKYECDTTLWPWQSRRLVEEHPVGAPIEVRYHPNRPDTAVIAWNLDHPRALMAFAFLVFSIGGCVAFMTRACLVSAPSH